MSREQLTSRIEYFQSSNDGSYVPGWIGSGTDPNDAAVISIPTGVKPLVPIHDPAVCAGNMPDTIKVLEAVQKIQEQAIDASSDFIAKATPNPSGVSAPTKKRFDSRR
jgi:hypothetical protein